MNSIGKYNHQVVLADDDEDHGMLFKIILKQVDPSKHLTIVKDGEELMNYLSHTTPDLIFLDLSMPCKNGIECLQEIKGKLGLKDLPVVVYSSSSHMTDIQKSYIHDADLYMVKPFNSYHLRNALQSILRMEWKQDIRHKYYFINNRFVPFTA